MVTPIDAHNTNKNGYYKSITIPAASVLTLHSVGYQLMTAPTHAYNVIVLQELFLRITTQTAYASVNDMTVGYGTTASTGVAITTVPGSGFLDQTTPTGVWASFDGTSSKGYILTQTSGGIYIAMGTGDPTTGTSPITVKLKYRIHSII